MEQQSNSGLSRFLFEDSKPHTIQHKSLRPLYTSDQPIARVHYSHNTQQTEDTNINALSGTRNLDPSSRAAVDLQLRPHGHRKRPRELYLKFLLIFCILCIGCNFRLSTRSGSEAWVLKKREEQRLEAAQMKFLGHLLGITKLDREKNQCIRQKNLEHRT